MPGIFLRVLDTVVVQSAKDEIFNVVGVNFVSALTRYTEFDNIVECLQRHFFHVKLISVANFFFSRLNDFVGAKETIFAWQSSLE